MFDSRKILVRPNSDDPTFTKAEWSDNVPKLLQAKIVQAFENAGLLRNVSRPAEAGVPEKLLAIDIRKFQISSTPEAHRRNRIRRKNTRRQRPDR